MRGSSHDATWAETSFKDGDSSAGGKDGRAAPAAADVVDDGPPGHPEEPGLQAGVVPQAGQAGMDLDEDVLEDVVHVGLVPHATPDEAADAVAERRPDRGGRRLPPGVLHLGFSARTKALAKRPSTLCASPSRPAAASIALASSAE